MNVAALHLHPIKGCRRVEVDRATVGRYGLVGDRAWQVVDATDGHFLTQRTHPGLVAVRPAIDGDGLVLRADGIDDLAVARPTKAGVTTPTYSGDVHAGDAGEEAAAWLTRVVGVPVRLVGIAPGYRRTIPPLFGDREMGFGDAAPILVVNDASHRFLVERAVEPFGIERFRPNIVVTTEEPWVEDTWRMLRVGPATIACTLPWPRCAVPQVDQETGERHREPAIVLKQHRWCAELPGAGRVEQALLCGNALFGMAAAADPVGATIAVGDSVEVLETGPRLLVN